MRFKDHVFVVTGAAGGIGYETARLACAEGAKVVVVDLKAEAVDAAVARLTEAGGDASGVAGDVRRHEDVTRNVADIMGRHGRIDVLVNNAGSQVNCPTRDMPEEHWRREIDINLTGPFFWSQAVGVASMIPRREGAIVNVGSGASLGAIPNSASYVASKHGLVGLTKSLAVDWGQYGIRVNCLCPGFTWTELSKSVAEKNPDAMKERVDRIPIGHAAQPADPARAILFLASRDAGSISGSVLSLDGGSSAIEPGYAPPRDR